MHGESGKQGRGLVKYRHPAPLRGAWCWMPGYPRAPLLRSASQDHPGLPLLRPFGPFRSARTAPALALRAIPITRGYLCFGPLGHSGQLGRHLLRASKEPRGGRCIGPSGRKKAPA
jgi:hypothetical protein